MIHAELSARPCFVAQALTALRSAALQHADSDWPDPAISSGLATGCNRLVCESAHPKFGPMKSERLDRLVVDDAVSVLQPIAAAPSKRVNGAGFRVAGPFGLGLIGFIG
ncbi:hypothetical protein [Novosphingobium sp.]|jgi:hypothetical protein|uniref:hypothetical protein n=1 Tax=Novosphingobium sp. TaxID=1874826 RepID=UPI002FE179C4